MAAGERLEAVFEKVFVGILADVRADEDPGRIENLSNSVDNIILNVFEVWLTS